MNDMMMHLVYGLLMGGTAGVSIAVLVQYWLPEDQIEIGRWVALATWAILFFTVSEKHIAMITIALAGGALHYYYDGEMKRYGVWFVAIVLLISIATSFV